MSKQALSWVAWCDMCRYVCWLCWAVAMYVCKVKVTIVIDGWSELLDTRFMRLVELINLTFLTQYRPLP